MRDAYLDRLPIAGRLVSENFAGWPPSLREEFARGGANGKVGQHLLSETSRLRVWEIRLAPGERVPAHCHVLDYSWTALTDGHSRQHTHDGTTREVTYRQGETREYGFAHGEYLLHDLENIGCGELAFITVEFLQSANPPLPLI